MEIKEIPINKVKPYEKNPRRNDEAVKYVKASIKEFGFKVPIVIDKGGIIVAGHTRHKAAKELHMKTVPCVVADDLNPEQVKAFRLADNKVSELAEWDEELLDLEMDDIFDIDMSEFGFSDDEDEPQEEKESGADYYGAEREKTYDAYNLYDIDLSRVSGKWQQPTLQRCDYIPTDLIGFNYAKTSKEFEKGIHFYIDDYQFERIWNNPQEYIGILEKYDCVLTPDFSLYRGMPRAMKLWNCFRSKLIGQIMQDNGLKVIPTLQWCEPETFDFCFDGLPKGGTVSVSTIGVKREEEASKIWFAGMDAAMEQLKPKTVVIYGGDIGYDFGKTRTLYINNHNTERMRNNAD